MSRNLRFKDDGEFRAFIASRQCGKTEAVRLVGEAVASSDGRLSIPSKLEARFEQQLNEHGIWPAKEDEPTGYWRNYLNAVPGRGYELDFAWYAFKFAVEVDGSAHRTKGRFKRDFEKHAELMLAGWRVLRVGGDDVRHGRAIAWTLQLLAKT